MNGHVPALPENYVDILRESLVGGNMAVAQSLVAEFEGMLSEHAGTNKAAVYSSLRNEVLMGFTAAQRASYEALLLEAGAL